MAKKASAEETVRTIRRKTKRQHHAEEKIRIVLEGLRGEDTVAELCRREGIAQSLYYKWSKRFWPSPEPLQTTMISTHPLRTA